MRQKSGSVRAPWTIYSSLPLKNQFKNDLLDIDSATIVFRDVSFEYCASWTDACLPLDQSERTSAWTRILFGCGSFSRGLEKLETPYHDTHQTTLQSPGPWCYSAQHLTRTTVYTRR